jgi:transcriptional regulator with XRE-family HTH domain
MAVEQSNLLTPSAGELARPAAQEPGRVIRRRREERAISQQRLADASGVSRNYVSELERGLKSPSLRVVESLARVFGVRASELVSEAESL